MKRIIAIPLTAIVAVTIFISCNKDKTPPCTPYTSQQDRAVIDSYLTANGFTGIQYNAGTATTAEYYAGTINSGSGSLPAGDSVITFDIVTRLMNGTVLDSTRYPRNTFTTIKYSDLNTQGNEFYSPLIYNMFSSLREGGVFRAINLSRNQFGCQPTTLLNGRVVPANSQIITDYKLVDVKATP